MTTEAVATAEAEVKPRYKLAMYWASACGGCDVAVLNLGMKLIEFTERWEPVFWPAAMDGKQSSRMKIKTRNFIRTPFESPQVRCGPQFTKVDFAALLGSGTSIENISCSATSRATVESRTVSWATMVSSPRMTGAP